MNTRYTYELETNYNNLLKYEFYLLITVSGVSDITYDITVSLLMSMIWT